MNIAKLRKLQARILKTPQRFTMAEGLKIFNNEIWKTERNAEAIVKMAIMRRGIRTSFYSEVPADTYKIGDVFTRP